MTNELRKSLQLFTEESARVLPTQEGCEFATMVAGTVNRLIEALENGRPADAKTEAFTFSRQLSDTYLEIPPQFGTYCADHREGQTIFGIAVPGDVGRFPGSNSTSLLIGVVAMRPSTSRRYSKGLR